MSRFVIETYNIGRQYTLRIIYFSHGYSALWMKNSMGVPTIPYVVLKNMVLQCLEEAGELSEDFFGNYQRVLEDALYQRLKDLGKLDGAKQRSMERSRIIGASLRAIIVEEEKMMGRAKVYYLNKTPDSPVVSYDDASGIIKVDEKLWLAGSNLNDSSDYTGTINKRKDGSWKKWWRNNSFLIWTSLLMLILVPSGMIWGMLYIKDKADQMTEVPVSGHASSINDTIQIDSTNVSK